MMEIIYKGEAYPCRSTLGAMLRFKQETGREVSEAVGFSDQCIYLWCCVVSASKADGKTFDVSLMEFLDALTPDDLTSFVQTLNADAGDSAGEKSKKK